MDQGAIREAGQKCLLFIELFIEHSKDWKTERVK